jgi:hypothetical protein
MCSSSAAAKSPMAQFLQSQKPDELWKASLKPKDPLKPDGPAKTSDPAGTAQPLPAAKPAGTGVTLDVMA